MSTKSIRTALVVLAASGAAFGIWWLVAPSFKPIHDPEQKTGVDFIKQFDSNGDGQVDWPEFEATYGKTDNVADANGKKLTASEAFRVFDLNHDGILNSKDQKPKKPDTWAQFKERASADGLRAHKFGKYFLRLNEMQLAWLVEIESSLKGDTLPWAGELFDRKYFTEWTQVNGPDSEVAQGFYLVLNEKQARLLTPEGKIRVIYRDQVSVSKVADTPQDEYIRRLKALRVNNVKGNLKLATDCQKWGFTATAKQLFKRVLVFDGQNKTALKALNLRVVNHQFRESQ